MLIEEIIGKRVTNIYLLSKIEVGGFDTGECFIELDSKTVIDIPFSFSKEIYLKELKKDAISLFADFSGLSVYHINKVNKTIVETANSNQQQRQTIFDRLRKVLFGKDISIKYNQPYKVDHKENELKNIKDKKIADFLWYADDSEKGFILFDNGYLITETPVANHGTGLAGLNLYGSLKDLTDAKGNDYYRLTDKKGSQNCTYM